MKEETIITSSLRPAPSFARRVSWGAIFAGLVVGMVTQIVLSLLGIAVGATAFNANEANPAAGYGTGAAIWLGISMLISAFVGACVAGRLSGGPRSTDGMLHGVITWSSATLLSVYLLTTTVGTLLGGAANVLGRVVSSGAQSASANGGSTMDSLKQQIARLFPKAEQALSPTGREESKTNLMAQAAQNPELMSALTSMFRKGGAKADPQDRDRAVNILVTQANMSQEDAANMVDRLDRQYQSTKAETSQKARAFGAQASENISGAAWGGFALLIISAALAAWGGWLGTRGLSYIQDERAAAASSV